MITTTMSKMRKLGRCDGRSVSFVGKYVEMNKIIFVIYNKLYVSWIYKIWYYYTFVIQT